MKRALPVLLILLGVTPFAQAQNISYLTATNMAVGLGQVPLVNQYGPAPNNEKWFKFYTAPNRSYCVSTTTAALEATQVDTVLTVYQGNATTVIGVNSDTDFDPYGWSGSRVCYENGSLTGTEYAKVIPGSSWERRTRSASSIRRCFVLGTLPEGDSKRSS